MCKWQAPCKNYKQNYKFLALSQFVGKNTHTLLFVGNFACRGALKDVFFVTSPEKQIIKTCGRKPIILSPMKLICTRKGHTGQMVQKSASPIDMVNIYSIYRVSYIPGGCLGFLPTVGLRNQKVTNWITWQFIFRLFGPTNGGESFLNWAIMDSIEQYSRPKVLKAPEEVTTCR